MNTILLNDTRSDEHIGCELVVTNSLRKCQEYGLNIRKTITISEASEASELIAPLLEDTDLVLLNGEGTLHDDKRNAIALLKAAKFASEKDCKIVLYNALWDNNPIGKSYLPCFDLIYCRDQKSLERLLADHPQAKAEFVPDMIFVTELPSFSDFTQSGILVSDSVDKKKCIRLTQFALKNDYAFAPMSVAYFRKLKKKPWLRYRISKRISNTTLEKIESPRDFISKILSSNYVITGRFHMACLCFLCDTPVYCISSNTTKIESLFDDFGLDSTSVTDELPPLSSMEEQWREQTRLRQTIQQNVKEAATKIDTMFQSISSLT